MKTIKALALSILLFGMTLAGQSSHEDHLASVTRGIDWHQVCDSQGSHNSATITTDPFAGTKVVWTPTTRMQGQSWDNIYIWQSNPTGVATRFGYTISMTLADAQSLDSLHAFEFEVQVVRSGLKYNLAWQVRKGSADLSLWTFDFAAKHWVDSGIRRPLSDLTPGKPSEWIALYEITTYEANSGPHHLGIYIDGQYYAVDIQRSAVPTNEGDYTNFAFQFDGSNKAETIAAQLDARLMTL